MHLFLCLGCELNWFKVKSLSVSCLYTLAISLTSLVEKLVNGTVILVLVLPLLLFSWSFGVKMSNSIIHKAKSVRYKALNILDLALPLIIRPIICYVLHCPNFSNQRLTLLSKLRGIDENVLSKSTLVISKVLLFGEHSFNNVKITSFNCHNWMHHLSFWVDIHWLIPRQTKRFSAW